MEVELYHVSIHEYTKTQRQHAGGYTHVPLRTVSQSEYIATKFSVIYTLTTQSYAPPVAKATGKLNDRSACASTYPD